MQSNGMCHTCIHDECKVTVWVPPGLLGMLKDSNWKTRNILRCTGRNPTNTAKLQLMLSQNNIANKTPIKPETTMETATISSEKELLYTLIMAKCLIESVHIWGSATLHCNVVLTTDREKQHKIKLVCFETRMECQELRRTIFRVLNQNASSKDLSKDVIQ